MKLFFSPHIRMVGLALSARLVFLFEYLLIFASAQL
jgi:hypothetical protein